MLPPSSPLTIVSTAVLQGLLIKYKQIYGLLAAIALVSTLLHQMLSSSLVKC